jgi:hypothetical protein
MTLGTHLLGSVKIEAAAVKSAPDGKTPQQDSHASHELQRPKQGGRVTRLC